MGKRLDVSIPILNEQLKERNIQCLSPKYLGTLSKHRWLCLKCGREWEVPYNNVINNEQGCIDCGYKIHADNKRLVFNTLNINEKLVNRNIEVLPNQENLYKTGHSKLEWKCLICERIWFASYTSIINTGRGCNECALKNRSGENHPNWRDGSSLKQYPKIWQSGKIQKYIRNRDNHRCQYPDCNYSDIYNNLLEVHHIDADKNNCNYWNLISLCKNHHKKIQWNFEKYQEYFYAITESYEF